MDLVTIDRVKEYATITKDVDDTRIGHLIADVSARMEQEMSRGIMLQSRTEDYSLTTGQRLVSLRTAPVTSVETVYLSDTRDFTDVTPLVENTDFILMPLRGQLRLLSLVAPLRDPYSGTPTAPLYVRVAYTGGMARSASDLANSYPAIAAACAQQVRYLLQRLNSLGGSVEMRDSKAEFVGEYTLLADVQKVCDYWKRRVA